MQELTLPHENLKLKIVYVVDLTRGGGTEVLLYVHMKEQ